MATFTLNAAVWLRHRLRATSDAASAVAAVRAALVVGVLAGRALGCFHWRG